MSSDRAESTSSPPIGERRQPGDDRLALGTAHTEEDDDGVGREPSRGEREGGRGRGVGEVEVVHHDGDRAVLGVAAEKAQHRGADREAIRAVGRSRGARERQRGGERICLDRRDAVERAERRPKKLQEHSEGDFTLGLEARGSEDPHLVEAGCGVVEKRGLPDARLPGECENAARTQASRGHEPIDRLLLGLAAHQHGPSLRGRGAGKD